MRAILIDGPHAGYMEVADDIGNVLHVADPGTNATRPFTRQRYVREPLAPGDFARGIEARFRWDP